MHLSPQTLSAAGDSPWIIPGPMLLATSIGLALTFSPDANLTANVQYTYDDPMQNPRVATLARAGVNLTITDPLHRLIAGDAILLSNPNQDPNNIWDGSAPGQAGTPYDIASITDPNNYVVTVANAGSAAGGGAVKSFRLFKHAVLNGITGAPPARIDSSLGWPVGAIRLNVSAYTAGSVTLTVQQAKGY